MTNEFAIEQSRISYVDLPAVVGGTILALAISLVLFNFGSVVGLAIPYEFHVKSENVLAIIIGVGLWVIWVQIIASFAGGYFVGRMRRPVAGATEHEREMRDGSHGVLVWATATVAVSIALSISAILVALITDQSIVNTEKTPESLQREHNVAIIFAFITASSSLVSGVASWWAATIGGEHRDNSIDHSHFISFRKRLFMDLYARKS